jgi:hypothetical protein
LFFTLDLVDASELGPMLGTAPMNDLTTTIPPLEAAASAPVAVAGFRAWLRRAAPGERLIYWRGVLARDRASGSPLEERVRARLDRLATAVLAAADAGLVHLVQRRCADDHFDYIATRANSDGGLA